MSLQVELEPDMVDRFRVEIGNEWFETKLGKPVPRHVAAARVVELVQQMNGLPLPPPPTKG